MNQNLIDLLKQSGTLKGKFTVDGGATTLKAAIETPDGKTELTLTDEAGDENYGSIEVSNVEYQNGGGYEAFADIYVFDLEFSGGHGYFTITFQDLYQQLALNKTVKGTVEDLTEDELKTTAEKADVNDRMLSAEFFGENKNYQQYDFESFSRVRKIDDKVYTATLDSPFAKVIFTVLEDGTINFEAVPHPSFEQAVKAGKVVGTTEDLVEAELEEMANSKGDINVVLWGTNDESYGEFEIQGIERTGDKTYSGKEEDTDATIIFTVGDDGTIAFEATLTPVD